MSRDDKAYLEKIPYKYRPIGAWKIFFLTLLYSIPVVGWIFLIAHSIGGANIPRRSFARHYWIIVLISLIAAGIAVALVFFVFGGASVFTDLWNKLMSLIKPQG